MHPWEGSIRHSVVTRMKPYLVIVGSTIDSGFSSN